MNRAAPILILSLAACGFNPSPDIPGGGGSAQTNTCNSDKDCSGATCKQNVCIANSYDLSGLLLQVSPHADATFGASTTYILDPGAQGLPLRDSKPLFARFDAKLPASLSISGGSIALSAAPTEPGCQVGPKYEIPANVTFYRLPPQPGFSMGAVHASAQGAKSLDVNLVPGQYDIYIEPGNVDGCSAFPPVLLPNQKIDVGNGGVWKLPPTSTLKGSVSGLPGAPEEWTVDLVEPSRGLPVSVGGYLSASTDASSFQLNASFSWLDKDVAPILRLTRTKHPAAPTIYWSLQGAVFNDTQTAPEVHFTVGQLAFDSVMMSGQVIGPDYGPGVPSRLVFQSTSLLGSDGANAAYSLSVETQSTGDVTVDLPPGSYAIRATPSDGNELSVTDLQKDVPASGSACVCGLTFPVAAKATLGGTLTTPTGQWLPNANVAVTPTQTPARSFLATTHMLDPLTVRPTSALTSDDGSFSLSVDLGTFDLTFQPEAGSNFPWLVLPHLSTDATSLDFTRSLSSPAILRGKVLDPGGSPIADVDVSAWLPIVSGTDTYVVKIATSTSDADGIYTLVMASSPPSPM